MSAASDVGSPQSLLCTRQVVFERTQDVVTTNDNEAGLVARGHDAEPAGLEVEVARTRDSRQRVHNDEDFSLEALPPLGGIDDAALNTTLSGS